MKLVMTLLVRNEVDLIRANLDYHLAQGVDFVIVTDHGSDDGTSEILREYGRDGVVQVIRDDERAHHQSDRVTRMTEIARVEQQADWVLNNDADEFWWPLVGDLRDVFSSLPAQYGQLEVQRRNFRPLSDGDGPFYSRLIYKEASSSNLRDDPLEPKVAHRPHPDLVVSPGNHTIHGVDLQAVPAGEVLEIFHFPMRSYEQFEQKVIKTGTGYALVADRAPLTGYDQLTLFELYNSGKLRDYYDELVLDEAARERGLEDGTIVIDRRLERFMVDLYGGERSSVRPEAPFAQTLLKRTMDALIENERSRKELESLRPERERAEHLSKRLAQLNEELERSKRELQSTSEALDLLRSSRLLRSTARARTAYYRVRGRG